MVELGAETFYRLKWFVLWRKKKCNKSTTFCQASNAVLLLQPDCPLRAHLLHGSPWIHSSTWLGGETHSRFSYNHLKQTLIENINHFPSDKDMFSDVHVSQHVHTCDKKAIWIVLDVPQNGHTDDLLLIITLNTQDNCNCQTNLRS